MKRKKVYNFISNSIASYNKSRINHDDVMMNGRRGNKYFGDDHKAVVIFLNKKGDKSIPDYFKNWK